MVSEEAARGAGCFVLPLVVRLEVWRWSFMEFLLLASTLTQAPDIQFSSVLSWFTSPTSLWTSAERLVLVSKMTGVQVLACVWTLVITQSVLGEWSSVVQAAALSTLRTFRGEFVLKNKLSHFFLGIIKRQFLKQLDKIPGTLLH